MKKLQVQEGISKIQEGLKDKDSKKQIVNEKKEK